MLSVKYCSGYFGAPAPLSFRRGVGGEVKKVLSVKWVLIRAGGYLGVFVMMWILRMADCIFLKTNSFPIVNKRVTISFINF